LTQTFDIGLDVRVFHYNMTPAVYSINQYVNKARYLEADNNTRSLYRGKSKHTYRYIPKTHAFKL